MNPLKSLQRLRVLRWIISGLVMAVAIFNLFRALGSIHTSRPLAVFGWLFFGCGMIATSSLTQLERKFAAEDRSAGMGTHYVR